MRCRVVDPVIEASAKPKNRSKFGEPVPPLVTCAGSCGRHEGVAYSCGGRSPVCPRYQRRGPGQRPRAAAADVPESDAVAVSELW